MSTIRNSFLGKGLKVLLIGYFLLSSLNLASSVDRILKDQNADVYRQTGMVCQMLKFFFDCEESVEEYEFEKQQTKSVKKGLVVLEYLLPNYYWGVPKKSLTSDKAFAQRSNLDQKGGLYSKIHLPPPERFL
ncbi:hypothetical protein [Flavobacterium sp.]|uniref:hypothetical protein n=1 Tax=Flavobacterium sp. TaxID=239 RepID=UPI001209326D|nr:hypothetical protein [Flavobacterium sp.]RZJ69529.1 MAG: hypothetical protein EOO49_17050 [Flavobacterium sp.]